MADRSDNELGTACVRGWQGARDGSSNVGVSVSSARPGREAAKAATVPPSELTAGLAGSSLRRQWRLAGSPLSPMG
uniref:Uncharacterized protein n=1 Tax=Oryza rufipogon TaxID=4529 RepID=A0A0E0NWL3_ORYRU